MNPSPPNDENGAPPGVRFFAYGRLLEGEADHAKIAGAPLIGATRTAAGYSLVEVMSLSALVEEGTGWVMGELYSLPPAVFQNVMRQSDHRNLFHLKPVRLEDGSSAEALFLHVDQVRGKRRIKDGDWKNRFGGRKAGELSPAGPFVHWSRTRPR